MANKLPKMQVSISKILILLLAVITPVSSNAEQGDELTVTESLVNVRSEPSADSEVLLKLKKGRNVTEIQQQQNWIEVELNRDDFQSGWIHKSLLSKSKIKKTTAQLTNFDKFKQRFTDQNEVIKKQNGIVHFADVVHKERGDIELLATDAWLNSDIEKRNNSLSEIFTLWSKFVPVGSSISIQVLDEQGERYTLMMR